MPRVDRSRDYSAIRRERLEHDAEPSSMIAKFGSLSTRIRQTTGSDKASGC